MLSDLGIGVDARGDVISTETGEVIHPDPDDEDGAFAVPPVTSKSGRRGVDNQGDGMNGQDAEGGGGLGGGESMVYGDSTADVAAFLGG